MVMASKIWKPSPLDCKLSRRSTYICLQDYRIACLQSLHTGQNTIWRKSSMTVENENHKENSSSHIFLNTDKCSATIISRVLDNDNPKRSYLTRQQMLNGLTYYCNFKLLLKTTGLQTSVVFAITICLNICLYSVSVHLHQTCSNISYKQSTLSLYKCGSSASANGLIWSGAVLGRWTIALTIRFSNTGFLSH